MKIIYGYSGADDETYVKYFKKIFSPANKYHNLLIEGFNLNGEKVECCSCLPINRSITKKRIIKIPDTEFNGITYRYYKTVNFPILRQIFIYFEAKKFLKNTDGDVIFSDCLNLFNSLALIKVAKKKKIPIIMIVTDIPEFQFFGYKRKIADYIISKADGFVFLTEQMNDKLNQGNKPYIVLEGHSDVNLNLLPLEEKLEYKTGKKTIVYAGSILKLYGIQNLVEGFIKANISDSELLIFGDGDYKDELKKIAQIYKNVKYMGVQPNTLVVDYELKASLLVNPRPVSPEYTKYSFPSKNMEYMASGTPVLTTNLPGMPNEYKDYVYIFDNDSVEGIKNSLINVFNKPLKERNEFGLKARDFVINKKSNVVQAKKILNFLQEEFNAK